MKKKCEHRHFEFTSAKDIVCAECGDKVLLEELWLSGKAPWKTWGNQ